jgi:hypothetical protein
MFLLENNERHFKTSDKVYRRSIKKIYLFSFFGGGGRGIWIQDLPAVIQLKPAGREDFKKPHTVQ